MKQELQKQIDELSEQITKLERNKLILQRQLIDLEDNFFKKFDIWIQSGNIIYMGLVIFKK